MKKYLLIIVALLLSACADKNQYQEAVLAQMQKEKDLKDYSITPEYITDCVVELSSRRMPGLFDLDPERMTAYRNYTKMLNVMNAEDPKKTMEQLRTDFGSPKALADAHANYAESLLECYTTVVSKTEGEDMDKGEAEKLDDSQQEPMNEDDSGMDDDQGAIEDSPGMEEEGQEAIEEEKPEEKKAK